MGDQWYQETEDYMMRLLTRNVELSKKRHEYCPGISLYPNEIHTVEYIAVSSATNLTDIASQMGLTRGAVSKMIGKLEEMGLLVRFKYNPRQKEIYVHLTELGVQAYEGHKAYHAQMNARLCQMFHGFSQEQKEAVMTYIRQYSLEYDQLEE